MEKKPRIRSEWNIYVQDHYKQVQSNYPGLPAYEIIKILSQEYHSLYPHGTRISKSEKYQIKHQPKHQWQEFVHNNFSRYQAMYPELNPSAIMIVLSQVYSGIPDDKLVIRNTTGGRAPSKKSKSKKPKVIQPVRI
jgi:hypothetical protein